MYINIKIYGDLKQYAPGQKNQFRLKITPETSLQDILGHLGVTVTANVSLVNAKGYDTTRVRDITSQAGMSPGNFYLYFKKKQDLYIFFSTELLKKMYDKASKIADLCIPANKKIRKLTQIIIQTYEESSNGLKNRST